MRASPTSPHFSTNRSHDVTDSSTLFDSTIRWEAQNPTKQIGKGAITQEPKTKPPHTRHVEPLDSLVRFVGTIRAPKRKSRFNLSCAPAPDVVTATAKVTATMRQRERAPITGHSHRPFVPMGTLHLLCFLAIYTTRLPQTLPSPQPL